MYNCNYLNKKIKLQFSFLIKSLFETFVADLYAVDNIQNLHYDSPKVFIK